jgi:hypothetical protein
MSAQIKKPALDGAGVGRNKNRRSKARRHISNKKPALEGRRMGSRDFPTALGGERIAR